MPSETREINKTMLDKTRIIIIIMYLLLEYHFHRISIFVHKKKLFILILWMKSSSSMYKVNGKRDEDWEILFLLSRIVCKIIVY